MPITNIHTRLIGDTPTIPVGTVVSMDTETTGLTWDAHIIGISLAWRSPTGDTLSCYLSVELANIDNQLSLFGSTYPAIDIRPVLEGIFQRNQIVFHSVSFDYRFVFKDLDMSPPKSIVDISQLAKCVDYQPSLSLINLYKRYIKWAIPEGILAAKQDRGNLHKRELGAQAEYARWDAVATLHLYEKLYGLATLVLDADILQHDEEFTYLVMCLIERGLPINLANLTQRREQYQTRNRNIVMELSKTHGLHDVGSDNQVAKYLFKRLGLIPTRFTPGGRGAVGAEDLQPFIHIHPAVPLIIEYRQLTKAISSWIDPLEKMASKDGKAHSQLDPFGTRSFRMSSKDINLQGMPMKARGERAFDTLMGVFKSDIPGEKLWAIDLKQAEVRLAAILAPDKGLATVLSTGADPYKAMSKELWGTEDRRQEAKQATLSAIYEIGPAVFSTRYKVSEADAKEILDTFRHRFPGIKRASNKWSSFVEHNKNVQLYTGRPRWFGPEDESWKGFNQVVQGGVAEMMSAIMLEVERVLQGRLLLQIHDSLVMYLPDNEVRRSEYVSTIETIATEILPEDVRRNVTPQVPILCDTELWE